LYNGGRDAAVAELSPRDGLIAGDPKSCEIIRPNIREQDVDRWRAAWGGLWMIALKSSSDHSWPWADVGEQAEVSG
jgi:hypothetical protein